LVSKELQPKPFFRDFCWSLSISFRLGLPSSHTYIEMASEFVHFSVLTELLSLDRFNFFILVLRGIGNNDHAFPMIWTGIDTENRQEKKKRETGYIE
jgi:hypothetical protein